ncbi:MAG: pentapeptide repeat-containing protein [Bacteroidetes bacterium]|nr:pentapeptide repeat-containing protein [Bacteroidota bacterium]
MKVNDNKFISLLLTWESEKQKNKSNIDQYYTFNDEEFNNIVLSDTHNDSEPELELAYIRRVDFVNTILSKSTFIGVTFDTLNFYYESYFNECEFYYCKFENVKIRYWPNNKFLNCEFIECYIDQRTFSKNKITNFQNCVFKSCKISIDDFSGFEGGEFQNVTFYDLVINRKSTSEVITFIGCKIESIDFLAEKMIGLHFNNCIFSNYTYLKNKSIENCTFIGINYLTFRNCNGKNIDFTNSTLSLHDKPKQQILQMINVINITIIAYQCEPQKSLTHNVPTPCARCRLRTRNCQPI